MALSAKQKLFLDTYLENPSLPMSVVARQLDMSPETVYSWKKNDKNGFATTLETELQRRWDEARAMASENLFTLAREGDFKAIKYILDYSGYAPTKKVEAEVNQTVNEIKINIQ